MRNIKLTIEYDGTAYEGWQIQNPPKTFPKFIPRQRKATIQDTIEQALRKILHEKVRLHGSGRTDAGVHALRQVANFSTASSIPLDGLQKGLNALLPHDISIASAADAPAAFHSRFSAKGKLYRYTILNRDYPSALRHNFVYYIDSPLSVAAMRREAAGLKGTHDFRSFHGVDDSKKGRSSVRTIRSISIRKNASDIIIDIEADGFMKNMVRTIVGTLVEIGRGRFPRGSMKRILAARDRKAAGPTAPAAGLCLILVRY